MYRSVFALIVSINDYESEMCLGTKHATYQEIPAWVKRRCGIHVSNLAISQAKERCGLAKNEYKDCESVKGHSTPKLTAKKEAAIREAFIWFGLIKEEYPQKGAVPTRVLFFCISRCRQEQVRHS